MNKVFPDDLKENGGESELLNLKVNGKCKEISNDPFAVCISLRISLKLGINPHANRIRGFPIWRLNNAEDHLTPLNPA